MSFIVNKDGSIVFPSGKTRAIFLNGSGYRVFKYLGKRHTVHRLVAEWFIPNPECKSDVNHIDGNKENNSVENLEWVSRTENLYHALRNGLHDKEETPVIGIKNGVVARFVSMAEAARQTGTWQPNIWKVVAGQRRTAGGYEWQKA